MRKFQSYFTPDGSEEEQSEKEQRQRDNTQPAHGRSGNPPESEKGHQLQPITRRGRQPLPRSVETPPPPAPGYAGGGGLTPSRASALSIPSLAQSRHHDSATPTDGASVRTTRKSPGTSRANSRSRPTSRSGSRVGSMIFPRGDSRNDDADTVSELRNDMMVNWLYEQQLRKQYATGMDPYEGAVLKKSRGNFTCCPPHMAGIPHSLYAVVSDMNVRCAMTVNTPVVRALLDSLMAKGDIDYVPLPDGLRVQILATMADLPRGQLHHFAAFIEDVRMLVVWDDEPEKLLGRVEDLEKRFVELIWGNGDNNDDDEESADEKKKGQDLEPAQLEEAMAEEKRPVRLESALIVALTLALCLSCLALGWRNLAFQSTVDGDYTRWALMAVAPLQFFVSLVRGPIPLPGSPYPLLFLLLMLFLLPRQALTAKQFFFQVIITNMFQMLGPISAVTSNSKYFSGKAPRRLQRTPEGLPHVTIQMPVYKEGLAAVIRPTIMSLKAAISTYEMQGGSANVFINDDGMQVISDEEAMARRDFYEEHNIGWVARPPHNPKPNLEAGERLFLRRGKFKKASNLNYALHLSNVVEEKLEKVNRSDGWTIALEANAYRQCLSEALQENDGYTWAEGNIRIGDYILLIDSDTRVPQDCLLDAVSEMEQSPEVAICQFSSGVMNVTNSFFENG